MIPMEVCISKYRERDGRKPLKLLKLRDMCCEGKEGLEVLQACVRIKLRLFAMFYLYISLA
jgi:hypothetical protein